MMEEREEKSSGLYGGPPTHSAARMPLERTSTAQRVTHHYLVFLREEIRHVSVLLESCRTGT